MSAIDLLSLGPESLERVIQEWGHPRFRAKQLWKWIYDGCVNDFDEMSNLPLALRRELAERTCIGTLSVAAEQRSRDGTVKRLYRLASGHHVESVLMRYRDGRRTACISTQAGCAMACAFCATGQMGFGRHLDEAEIVEQAWRYRAELARGGERLSNVVLMGMGEPFHNYDATVGAIRRLMGDLGIGARHITVSTVGLVPQIRRFAEEGLQVRLAVSLHAATDEARGAMMPVNRRWPLSELMAACRDYVRVTRRRITFEWALIAGVNDDEGTARRLAELLDGIDAHVNLIPLNPTQGYEGDPTAGPEADRFVEVLEDRGVPATIRIRRGIDIDAGCGQLAHDAS